MLATDHDGDVSWDPDDARHEGAQARKIAGQLELHVSTAMCVEVPGSVHPSDDCERRPSQAQSISDGDVSGDDLYRDQAGIFSRTGNFGLPFPGSSCKATGAVRGVCWNCLELGDGTLFLAASSSC